MSRFKLIATAAVIAANAAWLILPVTSDAGPARTRRQKAAMQDNLLPHTDVVPPKILEREYTRMRVTPYEDPAFYFELVVPRDFENQPIQVSRQALEQDDASPLPMAEFHPKNDRTVLIEARYIRVPERISLDRFIEVYVRQSGFEFVKRQRGDYSGRRVEDALLRIESPSLGTTLTRLTVSRRGDLIFLIAGSAKEADYPKWKQAFAVAALSFNPKGKP
jgi:hypothetical protein